MAFKKHDGFSLYEVLIVLAVIAIIGAFSVPMVNNIINKAKFTKIINDMKVIQNSIIQYYYDNDSFPDNIDTLVDNDYIESSPENVSFKTLNNVVFVYYTEQISNPDNLEKLDTTLNWNSNTEYFSSLNEEPDNNSRIPVLRMAF
ncbi:type II secretion system protein [Marinitoga sp. 1137]|uniref:type II secretion system protein n=1 Tax=Marinitoga sp. 1137 TaxID=1545835 RepID=UPI000951EBEF|nr:type II secretion system protein [Marinitoga sp. 1137]